MDENNNPNMLSRPAFITPAHIGILIVVALIMFVLGFLVGNAAT